MATEIKYNNISIQPLKVDRPLTKNTVINGKDNLSWAEINQKSTSDRRKRRVAHVAKFCVPIIKDPIPPAVKQEKPKQKNLKQKKPKIKKTENDQFKNVQNLGNQHIKIKNLRNFIATIPWSYNDGYFGRSNSEKRDSDSLESTTATAKKRKIN